MSANAYAIKPNSPFIAKNRLKRTPASESNKEMAKFLDTHEFSFRVDSKTKAITTTITEKEN